MSNYVLFEVVNKRSGVKLFRWNNKFFIFFSSYYFSNKMNDKTVALFYPKGQRPQLPYPQNEKK